MRDLDFVLDIVKPFFGGNSSQPIQGGLYGYIAMENDSHFLLDRIICLNPGAFARSPQKGQRRVQGTPDLAQRGRNPPLQDEF